MRSVHLALSAVAACVLVVAATLVSVREREVDEIASLVQRVSDAGVPGVLLLVRDGDTNRTEIRGVADGERSRSIRASDRFRIGSVTKPFVAVVVLQLVADGSIRLDEVAAFCEGA